MKNRLIAIFLGVAIGLSILSIAGLPPGSVETISAHGQRAANHQHIDKKAGYSGACVNLKSNPYGEYYIIHTFPSANYNYNGQWHTHNVSWDDQGHIVGGPSIGKAPVCGRK